MSNLLIVDMQRTFKASKTVVWATKRAIRKARALKKSIYVLEYSEDYYDNKLPPTLSAIRKVLSDTEHVVIKKDNDDGSLELNEAVPVLKQHFLVCGVNATGCVMATAQGLQKLGAKITLVEDACADSFYPKTWLEEILYWWDKRLEPPNFTTVDEI